MYHWCIGRFWQCMHEGGISNKLNSILNSINAVTRWGGHTHVPCVPPPCSDTLRGTHTCTLCPSPMQWHVEGDTHMYPVSLPHAMARWGGTHTCTLCPSPMQWHVEGDTHMYPVSLPHAMTRWGGHTHVPCVPPPCSSYMCVCIDLPTVNVSRSSVVSGGDVFMSRHWPTSVKYVIWEKGEGRDIRGREGGRKRRGGRGERRERGKTDDIYNVWYTSWNSSSSCT